MNYICKKYKSTKKCIKTKIEKTISKIINNITHKIKLLLLQTYDNNKLYIWISIILAIILSTGLFICTFRYILWIIINILIPIIKLCLIKKIFYSLILIIFISLIILDKYDTTEKLIIKKKINIIENYFILKQEKSQIKNKINIIENYFALKQEKVEITQKKTQINNLTLIEDDDGLIEIIENNIQNQKI
jgi:hypothetical protein